MVVLYFVFVFGVACVNFCACCGLFGVVYLDMQQYRYVPGIGYCGTDCRWACINTCDPSKLCLALLCS